MAYQFIDAYGSVLTAASNTVGGAQQPIVQIGSIFGTLPVVFSGNASVSGTVGATQVGAWTTSVVGGVSILGGTVSITPSSVSGVGLFNVNHTGNGSVLTQVQGSVITVWKDSSILSVPTGSVITVVQAASIAGTYTEDSAHTTNDRGVFTLGFRNDTMSSVTSADGDYSSGTYGPIGETITANSPITKWFSTQTSVMYGTSVQSVAPQGASVFTYITGVQVANDSATFSRIKFTGGLGSVLGWTVAPANGGSNINFINPLRTGENSGFSASISGVSSIYISTQGFTSKT